MDLVLETSKWSFQPFPFQVLSGFFSASSGASVVCATLPPFPWTGTHEASVVRCLDWDFALNGFAFSGENPRILLLFLLLFLHRTGRSGVTVWWVPWVWGKRGAPVIWKGMEMQVICYCISTIIITIFINTINISFYIYHHIIYTGSFLRLIGLKKA